MIFIPEKNRLRFEVYQCCNTNRQKFFDFEVNMSKHGHMLGAFFSIKLWRKKRMR